MTEKTITRADLIDALVKEVSLPRQDCGMMLETVLGLVEAKLVAGETVKLARFGNFTVRSKRERVGRNPKTGVEASIAPRRVVTFKPSQLLRERVADAQKQLEPAR
jgi:integration host factor subunit alpha